MDTFHPWPSQRELSAESARTMRDAEAAAEVQAIANARRMWLAARDEFARLCNYHRHSAAALADADAALHELANELQHKARAI